jgi:hypothetical protein
MMSSNLSELQNLTPGLGEDSFTAFPQLPLCEADGFVWPNWKIRAFQRKARESAWQPSEIG